MGLRSQHFLQVLGHKPYDEVIAKQIPGVDAAEAEAARQAIRDKYAAVQDAVNAAKTPDAIKVALEVN